jgi:multidrug resistance protein, MATE family
MNITSNSADHKLTAHPRGSLRELWAISFPLMLSLMSSSLMFFWDRLLLARFSIEAHNAATSAGTIVAFLQFAFICTTCIAEVFVGQYYGAGKKEKTAIPVWQMIWMSLGSVFIFVPLGLFAGDYIFAGSIYEAMEINYFYYMMCFGPIFCLASSLSAFYIGRGSVKFVTLTVIAANVLNTLLAYVFIFGIEPYFSPMGITGAALATGISQLFQALVLFVDFLSKKNRDTYGTGNFRFSWDDFYICVKLGFPSSIAHTIEILAWALFFRMLMATGEEQLTVVSIAQSIFFLFTFLTEGVSKGATAIAANMIGAKEWKSLWKLLHSGIKFYIFLFVIFGSFLAFDPSPLIHLFLPADTETSPEVYKLIASSCLWVWIFFLLDGIHWLVVGLLTAVGDTKFVFKVGSSTVWLFALLPTYILVVIQGHPADMAWAMTAFYGLITSGLYLYRFYSMRWKNNLVLAT